MNQVLQQLLRSYVIETHGSDSPVTAPPPGPKLAPAYDRAYVQAHPELHTTDRHMFHYDRNPLPAEWEGDLPSGCYVRVFVINAWTIVRVLHTATGKRLRAPVMDALALRTDPLAIDGDAGETPRQLIDAQMLSASTSSQHSA